MVPPPRADQPEGTSTPGRASKENDTANPQAEDAAPYLVLLVPTDKFDWGEEDIGANNFYGSSWGGESRSWLEVGCQLKSARLVHDVNFHYK